MKMAGNVMIMQVILIFPSHENCGCFDNGNSQNVAKTYGSWHNNKNYSR